MDQAQNLRNIVKQHIETEKQKHSARVITVTSGKGGVGKTSTALNLAIELTKLGKKVIIFDADFGLANIEVMIGAVPRYNLSDMILRGKKLEEILLEGPLGIKYISGGSGINHFENLNKDQVIYLLHEFHQLETMADVIIIDTGAGISHTVMEFVASSREVILVTTPEPTSITDAYSLLKALNRHPAFEPDNTLIRLLANEAEDYADGKTLYDKLNTVVSRFLNMNLEFMGVVPDDPHMPKAIIMQKPVVLSYPKSKSAAAYSELAGALLNKSNAYGDEKRGLSYIFTKYLRLRKGK